MKRIAFFTAVALGVAPVAGAQPLRVFDPATGSPVVAVVSPMTNAEAGVTVADESKVEAVPFQVSAPGYQTRVVFQNKDIAGVLADRVIALCRNDAVDTDGDTLCDDAEKSYGTNPAKTDSDGDKFSDTAELFGFDGFDMVANGASPLARNLFLELDFYPSQPPSQAGVNQIIKSFADNGITLQVQIDDQVRPQDQDPDLNPFNTDLRRLEDIYRDRKGMAYWGLLGLQYSGGGSSGRAAGIPCDKFVVTLGTFRGDTQTRRDMTIMHEFGHCLGLLHGGRTNQTFVPNFFSLMSYTYQLVGLTIDGRPQQFGYTSFSLQGVNEASLNEAQAFAPAEGITEQQLARFTVRTRREGNIPGNASANLDFDRDGRISQQVSRDLDGDNQLEAFPVSRNEFATLVFGGAGLIGDALVSADERQTVMPAGISPVSAEEFEPCMSESDL